MPEIIITHDGQPAKVNCDGNCDKAWGISVRPKVQLSPDDEDDIYYLAVGELGMNEVSYKLRRAAIHAVNHGPIMLEAAEAIDRLEDLYQAEKMRADKYSELIIESINLMPNSPATIWWMTESGLKFGRRQIGTVGEESD